MKFEVSIALPENAPTDILSADLLLKHREVMFNLATEFVTSQIGCDSTPIIEEVLDHAITTAIVFDADLSDGGGIDHIYAGLRNIGFNVRTVRESHVATFFYSAYSKKEN